jgi:hypothetical protein
MADMDEPLRVVVEHYPAEKLPEQLRGAISCDSKVTVTVVQELPAPPRRKLSDLVGAGKGLYRSPEDVLEFLRAERDAD